MQKSMLVFLRLTRQRRLLRYALWLLCISCFVCGARAAEDDNLIDVETAVDRAIINIGDTVTYSITVKAKKDIEVTFPVFDENLGDLAVQDFGSKQKNLFGRQTLTQWYKLDTYVTGSYTIPPAIITYKQRDENKWHEIETEEVTVQVESFLSGAEDQTDIRDIKEPLHFPLKIYWFYILAGILLCVLGGGIFWCFRKVRRRAVITPRLPAHEIAYAAFDELRQKDFIAQNKLKEYYSELSFIVRQYLENRFTIRAPEMTTEEFLSSVKDARVLTFDQKTLLRMFLESSDMVKFAKYGPLPEEINGSFDVAKRLVDETKLETILGARQSKQEVA